MKTEGRVACVHRTRAEADLSEVRDEMLDLSSISHHAFFFLRMHRTLRSATIFLWTAMLSGRASLSDLDASMP